MLLRTTGSRCRKDRQVAPHPFAQANSAFAPARTAANFFRGARIWRIDLRPRNTLGFKQLAGSGAWAGARRIGSCVDKGSSLVAEIVNLGTAGATGGFPFATVQRSVSVFGSLSGNEIADEAGESPRHLIGKRHHAS
jgi:hypothetical protein